LNENFFPKPFWWRIDVFGGVIILLNIVMNENKIGWDDNRTSRRNGYRRIVVKIKVDFEELSLVVATIFFIFFLFDSTATFGMFYRFMLTFTMIISGLNKVRSPNAIFLANVFIHIYANIAYK
jgi:hypothetical protein